MRARVLALVPKRFRPASTLAGLWLASELVGLLLLASCETEPLMQGAARLIAG
jgi:hypothetical protein